MQARETAAATATAAPSAVMLLLQDPVGQGHLGRSRRWMAGDTRVSAHSIARVFGVHHQVMQLRQV